MSQLVWRNAVMSDAEHRDIVYVANISSGITRIGETSNGKLTIVVRMNELHYTHDPYSTWTFYYRVGSSGTYTALTLKAQNAPDSKMIEKAISLTVPISDKAGSLTVYAYIKVTTSMYGRQYVYDSSADKMVASYGGRAASIAPSGLTITRNGNKFEFGWIIPSAKYAKGQQLQWRVKEDATWQAWNTLSVNPTTTKKTVSIAPADYYPAKSETLSQVEFRVRGRSENTANYLMVWSGWTTKAFDVQPPNIPSMTAELSSDYTNVCTFSWTTSVDTKALKWFIDTQYQTILVKNCAETDGSKLGWKTSALGWATGTAGANGTITRTEDTALLANSSYTRWVRVRARGLQGNSAWRYVKHVYATPNQAVVKSTSVKATNANGYNAKVIWTASSTAANPIDRTMVQYNLIMPDEDLVCPTGNTGWTDAVEIRDTAGNDAASFPIDSLLTDDQCLYLRVNNVHDSNVRYGKASLALIGRLSDPENAAVSLNTSSYVATVTATNTSDVPDSFLAVVYRRKKSPGKDYVVGIIPHGSTSTECKLPNWTSDPNISFGIYACVGAYSKKTRADGTDAYAVTKRMISENTIWTEGDVPKAPSGVTVKTIDGATDTVRVTWNWSWSSADSAELSWADHEDAWESTNEPSTYTVINTDATAWNISGLTPGRRWFIRVRLVSEGVAGPWSAIKRIDLSSSPIKPSLVLSVATITKKSTFNAYWTFVSTDSTKQSYAKIVDTTVNNGVITRGKQIGYTESAQSLTIKCPSSWKTGELHYLSLRVTSASGHDSEWSDPVPIMVADPVSCAISQHSLEDVVITSDEDGAEVTRTVLSLTNMPMTITVTGAGAGGTTTVIIERAEDYHVERPGGEQFNGYKGETIAIVTQTGEAQIKIKNSMLLGLLDDEASYRLIATVEDGYGQTASMGLDFEVHWEHQAIMPIAEVRMSDSVAVIEATAPDGFVNGDKCDIYRLSIDAPVLIYKGAVFGISYVDPYPAIGENGGHRVVYRTVNGDYITEDGAIAWIDLPDGFDVDYSLIDFGGDQIRLPYNLTLSNQWKKDFQETKYLGGAVQGDWNPAVSRTLNLGTVLVTLKHEDSIASMRRLAVFPGICHIRTPDGSSFDADVQVSESRSYDAGGRVEFSLSITRVDPEGYDGMTLAEWEEMDR